MRLAAAARALTIDVEDHMHLWTPGQRLSRILYGAWSKRNISLGMITHGVLNIISLLFTLRLLLR